MTTETQATLLCVFENWCGRNAVIYEIPSRSDGLYFKVIDGGPIETFSKEDLADVKRNRGRTYGYSPNTLLAASLYELAALDAPNHDGNKGQTSSW